MTLKQERIVLSFIVLMAFMLRSLFIGHGSLWPDEALYLYISKNLTIDPLALKDVHGEWFFQNPPLFMYLLSLLIRTDILQPHVLAHSLTVAMDTGIVLISFFMGKRLFGPTAGLISAALLAVNPLHWWTSSRILLDIPLTFFIYLALLALIMNRYIAFYLFSFISLLTKYPAAPLFFIPLIKKERVKKYPWLWLSAYIGGLLLVIFALPNFRDIEPDHLRRFVNIFKPPDIQQAWLETNHFLGLPVFIFFIIGLVSALRKFDFSPLLIWVILFGTARFFLPWQIFRMSRYTLPLYPAIIIFASYGAVISLKFLKEIMPHKTKLLTVVFGVFFLYVLTTAFHKGYTASYYTTRTFVGFEEVRVFFEDQPMPAGVLTSSPRQVKYMYPELLVYDLPAKATPEKAEIIIDTNNIGYVVLDRWSPHQPDWALDYFIPDNGYIPALATRHLVVLRVQREPRLLLGSR